MAVVCPGRQRRVSGALGCEPSGHDIRPYTCARHKACDRDTWYHKAPSPRHACLAHQPYCLAKKAALRGFIQLLPTETAVVSSRQNVSKEGVGDAWRFSRVLECRPCATPTAGPSSSLHASTLLIVLVSPTPPPPVGLCHSHVGSVCLSRKVGKTSLPVLFRFVEAVISSTNGAAADEWLAEKSNNRARHLMREGA